MKNKTCTRCNKTLSIEMFHKMSSSIDGFRSMCKFCRKLSSQVRYRKDKYYIKKRNAKWRSHNPEYNKNWYKENQDKVKKYREDNKARRAEDSRKWADKNAKRFLQDETIPIDKRKCASCNEILSVDYYNKDRTKKYGIESVCRSCRSKIRREKSPSVHKYRMKNDINYRLSRVVRGKIKQALRKHYISGSAILLLGYSVDYFKKYIESKFKDNMSWDNYGLYGWHIDHIIPLSSFDLTDSSQIRVACHYTNMQPLWAKDNLRKGKNVKVSFSEK